MSPKTSKTLRTYARLHELLSNPVRASYRALKRSLTHGGISHKAKAKLYRRIIALTRYPIYVRPDGSAAEYRMVGLPIERDMLDIARRKTPRPDDAVWELLATVDPMALHNVGLPVIRYVVVLG